MNRKAIIFLTIVCGLAAIVAAFTTLTLFKQKQKRDEEELERYLDSSIQ